MVWTAGHVGGQLPVATLVGRQIGSTDVCEGSTFYCCPIYEIANSGAALLSMRLATSKHVCSYTAIGIVAYGITMEPLFDAA